MFQYKSFTIPCLGATESVESELNLFLRQRRVVSVKRELIRLDTNVYWTYCVEYVDGPVPEAEYDSKRGGKSKVDYMKILPPADFAIYAKLRKWRNTYANEHNVSYYSICYNEHLAAMAKNRCSTLAELRAIEGFGEGRASKFGEQLLAIIRDAVAQEQAELTQGTFESAGTFESPDAFTQTEGSCEEQEA